MRRILITGMSGVGKSSVIRALAASGLKAIDPDWNPEWEFVGTRGDEWVWREDRIRLLLDEEDADALFVSACVSNQAKFYDRFDQVILLSAPESVTVQRLANRTDNPYGKRPKKSPMCCATRQSSSRCCERPHPLRSIQAFRWPRLSPRFWKYPSSTIRRVRVMEGRRIGVGRSFPNANQAITLSGAAINLS